MQKPAVKLSDPKNAGFFSYRDHPNDLVQATRLAGLQLVNLDLAELQNKNQVLSAFAAGFSFPSYCGKNWDALNDALADLSWSKAAGWVLVVKDAAHFETKYPDEFTILIEVLESVVKTWQAEEKPFWVIFTGTAPQQNAIRELTLA